MQAFIQRTVTLKNITVTLKDFAVYEQRFQPLHKKLSNKMQVLSPYCRGDACCNCSRTSYRDRCGNSC